MRGIGGGGGGKGCVNAPDQRFALGGVSGERGEGADLGAAFLDRAGDAHGFEAEAEALIGSGGGGRDEGAIDHHVRVEDEDFLERAARGGVLAGLGGVHRGGARIGAVVREGEELAGCGDFGEDRVGAGVQADDGGEIMRGVAAGFAFGLRGAGGERDKQEAKNPSGPLAAGHLSICAAQKWRGEGGAALHQ